MRTEVKNKLHQELKANLTKVLVNYKDIVSWNDALKLAEEVIDHLEFEVKYPNIPRIEMSGLTTIGKGFNKAFKDFGYKLK